MIRPVLEYPAIPICVSSKNNIKKIQTVQNKALRRAIVRNPREDRRTNEDIHRETEIDPMNIRIYQLASNIWRKLEILNNNLVEKFLQYYTRATKDHYW